VCRYCVHTNRISNGKKQNLPNRTDLSLSLLPAARSGVVICKNWMIIGVELEQFGTTQIFFPSHVVELLDFSHSPWRRFFITSQIPRSVSELTVGGKEKAKEENNCVIQLHVSVNTDICITQKKNMCT